MWQRIRERRHGLIVSAAISLAISAVIGVIVFLFAGFGATGKAPPLAELVRRGVWKSVNVAAVMFWVFFLPQAAIDLLKSKDPSR
jgi:hypothetical protein